MTRHLESQESFVASFQSFHKLMLNGPTVLSNEENICRMFDIWLVNFKDERVIEEQMKKAPWEEDGSDY